MNISYKITRYFDYITPTEVGIYKINIDGNKTLNELIDIIKSKHIIDNEFHEIYIDNLVEKTWLQYFDQDFIINRMHCDSYHYKWLNEKLNNIQETFHLFCNELNIIIDGPGNGVIIDEEEGIKFIIHSNELDKHANYPHIHAEYSGEEIFIYLKDGKLLNNKGFKNNKKTKKAIKYVLENQEDLLKKWNLITGDNIKIDVSFYI